MRTLRTRPAPSPLHARLSLRATRLRSPKTDRRPGATLSGLDEDEECWARATAQARVRLTTFEPLLSKPPEANAARSRWNERAAGRAVPRGRPMYGVEGAGRVRNVRKARSRSLRQREPRLSSREPRFRCLPHPECRRGESSETTPEWPGEKRTRPCARDGRYRHASSSPVNQ